MSDLEYADLLKPAANIGPLKGVNPSIEIVEPPGEGAQLWATMPDDGSSRRLIDWGSTHDADKFLFDQQQRAVNVGPAGDQRGWWMFGGYVFRADHGLESSNVERLVRDVLGNPAVPVPDTEPADEALIADAGDAETAAYAEARAALERGIFQYEFPPPRSLGPLVGMHPQLDPVSDGVRLSARDDDEAVVWRAVPWNSESEAHEFLLRQWNEPRLVLEGQRFWMFRSQLFESEPGVSTDRLRRLLSDATSTSGSAAGDVVSEPGRGWRVSEIAEPRRNTGEYREKLPDGGELIVSSARWRIQYYWSGPDLRYNGTFFDIDGAQVPAKINALKVNWEEYERLKADLPRGGQFRTGGQGGMQINVGGYSNGVCLHSYHGQMQSREAVERRIEAYESALRRAPGLQALIFGRSV